MLFNKNVYSSYILQSKFIFHFINIKIVRFYFQSLLKIFYIKDIIYLLKYRRK